VSTRIILGFVLSQLNRNSRCFVSSFVMHYWWDDRWGGIIAFKLQNLQLLTILLQEIVLSFWGQLVLFSHQMTNCYTVTRILL